MTGIALGVALAGFTLCACAEANSVAVDGAPSAADAAQGAADGAPSRVDATPSPDAAPGTPDAAADASPGAADASVADAAGPADASPADANTPDATPCTPTWQPLLANGGFEAGNTTWVKAGNGGNIIKQQGGGLPFNAQAGTWAAHMVGFNSADQSLNQSVAVPAGATALRLRGYKCYVTTEPTTTIAYDTLAFQLRNAGGGSVLETLAAVSNLDAGSICSWTAFEYTAASAHAGQSIQLSLVGASDDLSLTSFVVDTLVLEALACP